MEELGNLLKEPSLKMGRGAEGKDAGQKSIYTNMFTFVRVERALRAVMGIRSLRR